MAASPQARELMGAAGALVVAEPTGNAPLLGHKGAFWLSAEASGTTAHGSMPSTGSAPRPSSVESSPLIEGGDSTVTEKRMPSHLGLSLGPRKMNPFARLDLFQAEIALPGKRVEGSRHKLDGSMLAAHFSGGIRAAGIDNNDL